MLAHEAPADNLHSPGPVLVNRPEVNRPRVADIDPILDPTRFERDLAGINRQHPGGIEVNQRGLGRQFQPDGARPAVELDGMQPEQGCSHPLLREVTVRSTLGQHIRAAILEPPQVGNLLIQRLDLLVQETVPAGQG